MDEWSKSQNVSSEQTHRTEPQPPPQAQTEQVNAVFTRSGKSDDSLKTQKDPPPSIIVNNKIKKDRPIKTSKGNYHVVKTEEYPFRETKQPIDVPISTRKPIRTMNEFVATPLKKTVASKSTHQKPRSNIRKKYEDASKTCRWWYSKITPPGYEWEPKSISGNVNMNLREIILFIIDCGCFKYMTGNLKLLSNFVEKFIGTVKFGNDQIALILGYGDMVQGNITIKRVYYVEGLNHNLFFVGQFCDADLEHGLWHRRLSHLNFDTISLLSKYDIVTGLPKLKFVKDRLCSSYELGKAKSEIVTKLNELDFLFSLMFDKLLNGTTQVVSKYSAITIVGAPNQCQQQHTTPSTSTTVAADTPPLNIEATPETQVKHQLKHQLSLLIRTLFKQKPIKNMHKLTKTNLSTSLVHRYKNEGRHLLDMLTRQTFIHSINDILQDIVGQKIIC
ncbi:retrovirus-related pol polyprotein from transposon TNT 1-94 [Tanacetum coccineum]